MKKTPSAKQKLKSAITEFLCFMAVLILNSGSLSAQETLSSDELFIKARKLAFDDKNYPAAIALTKQALIKSPDYADIRIFLGRLYTWTDKPDSARLAFDEVILKNPGYEDVSIAYGSLEYWNDNSEKALAIVTEGLKYNEKSEDLLLLQARILNDLQRFQDASKTLDYLLKINPNNSTARALSDKTANLGAKNKIGIDYSYVHFDKQFDDPWHLGSINYGRQTGIGSITGRVNYANRFKTNGTQFELDAYPRFSDLFYAYMSAGFAKKDGIFPNFRAGFSLYANLPASFEADLGFRVLKFSDETWIYTASIGKYYSNYWFNLRTYLTPSNNSVSKSLSLNIRYYFGGADDYLSFGIGSGLSPDNPRNNLLFNNGNNYKLKSKNISLGYRKSFKTSNVISFTGSLENQEYFQDTRGNQLQLSVGYLKRF